MGGTVERLLDALQVVGSTINSNLKVTVVRKGDGIVTIGDVIIGGSLGAFTAKASDLNFNGFTDTGVVKSIGIHDLVRPTGFIAVPAIQTGGAATDLLAITARNIADGFVISTSHADRRVHRRKRWRRFDHCGGARQVQHHGRCNEGQPCHRRSRGDHQGEGRRGFGRMEWREI